MKIVFLIAACCSVLAVALICIFLFMNGVPAIFKIGPLKFLTGTMWKPGNNIFGILPMIVGSICVTGLAILMGVPAVSYTHLDVYKRQGQIYTLNGDLGVGKTVLTQGFAKGLGITAVSYTHLVPSPSTWMEPPSRTKGRAL